MKGEGEMTNRQYLDLGDASIAHSKGRTKVLRLGARAKPKTEVVIEERI